MTITCAHCKAVNGPDSQFCAVCGARIEVRYLGITQSNWAGLAVVAGVLCLVVFLAFNSRSRSSYQVAPTEPIPSPTLSASDRLKNAKTHIADNNYDEALNELSSISDSTAAEYKEAQRLIPKARKESLARVEKSMLESRRSFVREAEEKFLKNGQDVYVSLSGPKETTITFRYVLISRPVVYSVTNDDAFMARLRLLGFRKAVFTDGYFNTWRIDV